MVRGNRQTGGRRMEDAYADWSGVPPFSRPLLPNLHRLHLRLGDLQHRSQLPNTVCQGAGAEVTVIFLDHSGVRVAQLGRDIGQRNSLVYQARGIGMA